MAEVINPTVFYNNQQRQATLDADEERKLFLGGLSWDTTEDDLTDYFGQFGSVSNVSIKYNSATGNPRGFGFITFSSDGAIDAVLSSGPHSVRNKVIDPRKAKSKVNANLKKIFVGGVDSNLTEEEIKQYFSRFGRVDGIELPFDKIRNRRREFCFIIFDSKEAADSACGESKQLIGGRECDIKRAQPQSTNGTGTSNGHQGSRGPRNGGGYSNGSTGGYQMAYHQSDYSDGQSWAYQSNGSGYGGYNNGGNWRDGGNRRSGSGNSNGGGYRHPAGGNSAGYHRQRVYGNSNSSYGGYTN